MKTLEELKEMRNQKLAETKKELEDAVTEEEKELLEKIYKSQLSCNFVAYNNEYKNIQLNEDYEGARDYAQSGGQVLVLNKDKIYTYKDKTEEEYERLIENQVREESKNMMNKFGL